MTMIYRVDYMLAVLLAGSLIGATIRRRAAGIEPARLSRLYFVVVVVLLAFRATAFVCGLVLSHGTVWNRVGSGLGDALNFSLGALFGLALGGAGRLALLREPPVYSALCLSTSLSFVIAGFSKALYMQGMIEFFTQSGYSVPFLKFIMSIEVLGGLALLVPWAVLPMIAGLSIDMFGAVYTHIHNGDPIHDSTGAIALLIRLGVIAVLRILSRQSLAQALSLRKSFLLVGGGAVICLVLAVSGSALAGHSQQAAPAQAAADPFDYFVGAWSCVGTFTQSGRRIEADLHFEKTPDRRWLLFRHDDRPPNAYHALAEWSRGEHEWTATVEDSFAGLRLFHSTGWQGSHLSWEGGVIEKPAPRSQRFSFDQIDASHFKLSYDVKQSESWQLVDSSTCTNASR
jgi:uncharacterized membrane protein YphA (DoxX/SURF4 family)